MGYEMRAIAVTISIALVFISATYAATTVSVYFDPPYTPSTCFGNQNVGPMVAVVGRDLWNNRAACKNSYRVKCTGGERPTDRPCKDGASVVVKVVGVCTLRCNETTIVLSRAAFAKIADLQYGVVYVDYYKV